MRPPALLVVLVHQLVVLALAVGLRLDQLRLVDAAVDELLLRQVPLENPILLLHVQTVERLRLDHLASREGSAVELTQHGQFVDHLQTVVLALLKRVVAEVEDCQKHQILEVVHLSDMPDAILCQTQLSQGHEVHQTAQFPQFIDRKVEHPQVLQFSEALSGLDLVVAEVQLG